MPPNCSSSSVLRPDAAPPRRPAEPIPNLCSVGASVFPFNHIDPHESFLNQHLPHDRSEGPQRHNNGEILPVVTSPDRDRVPTLLGCDDRLQFRQRACGLVVHSHDDIADL